MKTNVIFSLVIGLLYVSPLSLKAYDFKMDGIYYNFVSGTTDQVAVTYDNVSYEYYRGDIVVPKTVSWNNKTYTATVIGNSAFESCSNLTSINLPNSITTIGNNAFESCSNLVSINLPNSITTIGYYAFEYCRSLTSIAIPKSVTIIESGAFYDCRVLTSITIPDSVTTIRSSAFYNCIDLTSIIIPKSVTSIESGAFNGCGSLASITLPESISTIGDKAFYGCKFSSVKIPNSLTSISGNSFGGNYFTTVEVDVNNSNFSVADGILYNKAKTKLVLYPTGKKESALIVPSSVDSIGDYAFYSCSNITSITLPKTVKNIGNETFWYCSNLASINMPQSLKTIGSWAFESCRNLKEITFPDSLKTIGYAAFEMCGFSTITIPAGTKSLFEAAPVWQDFKNIVEKWPAGIPVIQPEPKVFVSGNTLHLNTPVSETVSVYSISGQLLYSTDKSAGEKQISLENSRNNIVIVKGSSGWVRKVRF